MFNLLNSEIMKKKFELNELSTMSAHQLANLYNQSIETEDKQTLHEIQKEFIQRGVDSSVLLNENKSCFFHRNKIYLQEQFKEKSSIALHFKQSTTKLDIKVKVVFVTEPIISLKSFIDTDPILLVFCHNHLQTHIDATGINLFVLGGFNDEGNFSSMSILNSTEKGSFALLSQARISLLMPAGSEKLKWDYLEI
jgi:hypothetical protein